MRQALCYVLYILPTLCNLPTSLWDFYYLPNFTIEENKVQRVYVTCSRSQLSARGTGNLKPDLSNCKPHTFSHYAILPTMYSLQANEVWWVPIPLEFAHVVQGIWQPSQLLTDQFVSFKYFLYFFLDSPSIIEHLFDTRHYIGIGSAKIKIRYRLSSLRSHHLVSFTNRFGLLEASRSILIKWISVLYSSVF